MAEGVGGEVKIRKHLGGTPAVKELVRKAAKRAAELPPETVRDEWPTRRNQ